MTYEQMCETIAWSRFNLLGVESDPRYIFESSPTGELWQVHYEFDAVCRWIELQFGAVAA